MQQSTGRSSDTNEATADSKDGTCGKDNHYQKVLKKIDLSGLTHEQREQVRQMPREESSSVHC